MADSSIKKRLRQTHPTYAALQADWQFYLDSYMGGEHYRQKDYLFRHLRESPKNYEDRKQRAVYPNYSRKVIDINSAFIFKDPIKRDSDDPGFEEFQSNADRKGTPLTQIMAEQVGKLGMVAGHAVAVVDVPREAGVARTRRDDQLLGIRPYVSVYTPLDVVDWSIDARGAYRWIRVRECAPDDTGPLDERKKQRFIYRIWTTDECMVFDEDGTEIERSTHTLGEVPAVFIPIGEHMQHVDVGESKLTDIAPLNRAIYNYRSLLDEFLYRQAFNFLALPTDESLTPERIKALMQEIGVNNATFYPAKTNPPSYVSPPSDPAEMIMKAIEASAREIIELAKLQDRKSSSAEKSGIAHAYEFQESNAAFAKIAKNLEDGEKKIIRLFYKWQKKNDVPVSVQYPQNFNITTLADQLEEALSELTLDISDTFNKQVKKNIVQAALPGADAAVRDQIFDEIDAARPTDAIAAEVDRRLAQERTEQP